jgi:[protein-PII] uridylyltransferase
MRLLNLANHYGKRIDDETWEAIRQAMMQRTELPITEQTIGRFLDLMGQTGDLDERLRELHELRVLEKIVPAMSHARCLLQFNEYHKYTVDEHSIRAVRAVTKFLHDQGPLGEAYRSLRDKRTLHLALLLHDLGKGYVEDHSEVGRRIALETAQRLGLAEREARTLEFLVHKHLVMAHLAFRRDLHDEQVVVRFAVEVGSPEVLQMLYLLTAADVSAVGPGVWNQWKAELLTDLYQRTMRHLAGDAPGRQTPDALVRRREGLRALVAKSEHLPWWERQIAALPSWYLQEGPPGRIIEQLEALRQLPHQQVLAWGRYAAERSAVEYTIGTYEEITPGIFHKLTGALSSKGLQILSASIATLAEGMVLDRFYVTDGDFSGAPPATRIEEVCAALKTALLDSSGKPPSFRRIWKSAASASWPAPHAEPLDVKIDNSTAQAYTILDIFAHDRLGLLYTITRTIFELGLSVHLAKVATYRDQVLDVFYVTDAAGQKILDEGRLREIRQRLREAIAPEA